MSEQPEAPGGVGTLHPALGARPALGSIGAMTPRSRSKFIDPAIADYALDHSSGPDEVQLELQRVTAERTGRAAGMQIGDDQAVLLEILARATGARRAVEVGTFTGYSSL